jgi:hypothetical protein
MLDGEAKIGTHHAARHEATIRWVTISRREINDRPITKARRLTWEPTM